MLQEHMIIIIIRQNTLIAMGIKLDPIQTIRVMSMRSPIGTMAVTTTIRTTMDLMVGSITGMVTTGMHGDPTISTWGTGLIIHHMGIKSLMVTITGFNQTVMPTIMKGFIMDHLADMMVTFMHILVNRPIHILTQVHIPTLREDGTTILTHTLTQMPQPTTPTQIPQATTVTLQPLCTMQVVLAGSMMLPMEEEPQL